MDNLYKGVVIAVVVGLLGWGAWVTLGVAAAATKERVNHIQERIEEKLDIIQRTILDLHKE